ncbi:MAG: hypothetical protein EOM23_08015 [Candidatus Moranbacteria bacterium]|nr:hypothetical protein [Candidatus Moranbacteria bacterium]
MKTTTLKNNTLSYEERSQFDPKYEVYDLKGKFLCSYGTGWSLKSVMTGSGPDVYRVVLRMFLNGKRREIAEFFREDFIF